MFSTVLKAFDGPSGPLAPGTVVDSTTWRNETRLHGARYLRPATEVEVKAATKKSSARDAA